MRCATPADAGENGTGQTRFRYDSKASRAERNTGLHHLPAIRANPYGEGREGVGKTGHYQSRQNTHPTVKPVSLMRWLCRLSCPPGGLVLDPFVGSGSTAVAARAEGFRCIGIDQDLEYLQIAAGRLSQLSLFGGFAED
jgi:site-specific DNA-methyltransferase (adenine-specific)